MWRRQGSNAAGADDQFVVEQRLQVKVIEGLVRHWIAAQPLHDNIELTVAQFRIQPLDFLFAHVERHAGIPSGKAFDDRQKDRRDPIGATDFDFTRGRVRKELDVPNCLLQLVEGRTAAVQQGAAVNRRLDAARGAIQQFCPNRVLQVGDQLRHRWMRHSEVGSRFCKTAVLHDREEHMQIPQLQAPANVTVPVDDFCHK